MLMWKEFISGEHDGIYVGKVLAHFCVGALWVLWFVNQYYLFVILLNFLIAVLSESYNDMVYRKLEHVYKLKAELNKKRLIYNEAWGKKT
jgi:hypothetical protein